MSFSESASELDIILRLSNLQSFLAGTREAAASVRDIGASADKSSVGSKLAGVAGTVMKAAKGAALGIAAIGYESTKMAIKFDASMELIHTQAGASQKEVNEMSAAILKMDQSGKYAQGPQQLAEGLFHLESIGLRAHSSLLKGANAMHALQVAAQGASVGGSNLEDTTTALGSAWLVQMKGAGSLNHVMALLNATVGAGNMRMQDLVTSLGTGVLAAGKLAHLSIQQVFGALAVLSDEGYRGSSAMAQFATSLHFLTDPTNKAKDAFTVLHLKALQLSQVMAGRGGLPAALALLKTNLAKYGGSQANQEALLGNILPAGRGRVLEVLMNQVDRYRMKLGQIAKTSKNFGQDVTATQQTAAFKIKASWASIQASMIAFGHQLEPLAILFAHALAFLAKGLVYIIPVAKEVGTAVVHWVIDTFHNVVNWVNRNKSWLEPLAIGIGAIVAGFAALQLAAAAYMVYTGAMALATGILDLALSPIELTILAIVAAVALIGVAFFELYKHSQTFRTMVASVWNFIKVYVTTAWDLVKTVFAAGAKFVAGIMSGLFTALKGVWDIIKGLFTANPKLIWKGVEDIFSGAIKIVGTIFSTLIGVVKGVFKTILDHLGSLVSSFFNAGWNIGKAIVHAFVKVAGAILGAITYPFRAAFKWVKNHLPHFTIHHIGPIPIPLPSFASGGIMPFSGTALVGERGPEIVNLPKGTSIQPLATGTAGTVSLGANMIPQVIVSVQIERKEVARAVGKFTSDGKARR